MTSADAPEPGTPVAAAGARPGAVRSARRQFARTTLALQAFVVLFATLVAFGLRVAPPATVWLAGGALALSLLLAAGLLGRPGGYAAGWVLQGVMVAGLAALPPVMLPSAVVVVVAFLALWVAGLRLGARIDRERRERAAGAPPAGAPPAGPAAGTPPATG